MRGAGDDPEVEQQRSYMAEFEPGPIPPLRPVDRYGFLKSDQSAGTATTASAATTPPPPTEVSSKSKPRNDRDRHAKISLTLI